MTISISTAAWGLVGILVTAIAGIVTAKVTSGGAERAALVPAKLAIEAEALTNAVALWKEQLATVKAEVVELRRAQIEDRATIRSLVEGGKESEQRDRQLTERVRILEQVLADNDIPVPPWHVSPGLEGR